MKPKLEDGARPLLVTLENTSQEEIIGVTVLWDVNHTFLKVCVIVIPASALEYRQFITFWDKSHIAQKSLWDYQVHFVMIFSFCQ
jgi:hypothetical protein